MFSDIDTGKVLNSTPSFLQCVCYLPPLTTTVNEHVPMCPEGSSKVAVTMVVPSVKLLPDAELTPTRLVIPELSVASGGVNVTAA